MRKKKEFLTTTGTVETSSSTSRDHGSCHTKKECSNFVKNAATFFFFGERLASRRAGGQAFFFLAGMFFVLFPLGFRAFQEIVRKRENDEGLVWVLADLLFFFLFLFFFSFPPCSGLTIRDLVSCRVKTVFFSSFLDLLAASFTLMMGVLLLGF